jgi:hypothetical protein
MIILPVGQIMSLPPTTDFEPGLLLSVFNPVEKPASRVIKNYPLSEKPKCQRVSCSWPEMWTSPCG